MQSFLLAASLVLLVPAQSRSDGDSSDRLTRSYYEVISGPAGQAPDRARDERLHATGAIVGLARELHRVTRQFGNVAHVWSTYAAGTPERRRVTSLQLHFEGSRWQIVSWLSDRPTSSRSIPPDLPPQATSTGGDEAAIRELVKQYNNAREANDPKAIEALFVADADQLVSSGEWRRGRDVLVKGAMASSARTGGTRTLTVESIRMVAPDAAIADARYEISGLPDGSTRKMWSTFVMVKQGGTWRISAIRNMLPAVSPPQR
jgi:uncharacterized protein (TIGR02246 family)